MFFGVVRCDCRYQLIQALYKIAKEKKGMIIYAIDQDCRGLGIDKHFETYFLRQKYRLETRGVYKKLNLKIDNREYKDIPKILHFYGIKGVRCLTNNPQKLQCIKDAGIKCKHIPLEIPLDDNNKTLLMDIKENLNYKFSFKTHQEWFSYIDSKFIEKDTCKEKNKQACVITEDYKTIIAEEYGMSNNCNHIIKKTLEHLDSKKSDIKIYFKGNICKECLKILREKRIKTIYINRDIDKLTKKLLSDSGVNVEII